MTADPAAPRLPGYAHHFEAGVSSDARTHDLDEDCWCGPEVDDEKRSITHREEEPSTSCEDLCMDECIGACGVFSQ